MEVKGSQFLRNPKNDRFVSCVLYTQTQTSLVIIYRLRKITNCKISFSFTVYLDIHRMVLIKLNHSLSIIQIALLRQNIIPVDKMFTHLAQFSGGGGV